ncbi:MAG TPA: queuosine salvage family protein [Thermodesulfobacteriota bacterium]|nr:queuosine salvage family protein [Thermodesulfobacteriota bacterium]
MWEVLETCKAVAEKSLLVSLDKPALNNCAHLLAKEHIAIPPWNTYYHFSGEKEEVVAYLLVLDSINFCFWPAPGNPKWEVEYQSEKLSGYFALAAALKKALESGVPLTHASYLAELSLSEFRKILGGKGNLQLLQSRVQNLNELGRVLLRAYNGKAYNLVEAAAQSALKLVRLVAGALSSFQDTAAYHGKKVLFYKRAQILAADLYGALQGNDWGSFHDIDLLTAFADYKLPQVLRHLGVLRYEKALAQKVDQHILLNAGSPEEVEIRANTIWAVELIRQKLLTRGKNLNAIEIDWILWNLGQHNDYRLKPYHRTLTIFY